jgi:plasmid stabilization system protein ParE
MKVVLHAGATAELEEAEDWYEDQRAGLGDDLAAEVDRALEVIRESPTIWPRWPESPIAPYVRRYLMSRFPYALAYIAEPARIVVLAVAHTKRRPGYWFHRLKRPS